MQLIDEIYGTFEIEPILEALIKSKPVQRLKGIHQGGASYLVNSAWNGTRYEHSIGTMLLIRLLGGSIEEQIAGLLHDVSHTAFSHVVDFALGLEAEDYHEVIYEELILSSDISMLLEDAGYNVHDLLFNESRWTILEQSAPKLCADRVDYTLRDQFKCGVISVEDIQNFLKELTIHQGEIVMTSLVGAEWFVEVYYKEVIDYFMHPLNVYAYHNLSQAIQKALACEDLQLSDLLKNDEDVLNLLKQSQSSDVLESLNRLNKKVNLIEDEMDFDLYQKHKVRMIDPGFLIENRRYHSSEKSKRIQVMGEEALRKATKGIYLKIQTV